jgi:hypothetical protein
VIDILIHRADISEQMGTKTGLTDARYGLQHVWTRLPAKGQFASRIAPKLGDLNLRLGDVNNALAWWARCIQMILPTSVITLSQSNNNKINSLSNATKFAFGSATIYFLFRVRPISASRGRVRQFLRAQFAPDGLVIFRANQVLPALDPSHFTTCQHLCYSTNRP